MFFFNFNLKKIALIAVSLFIPFFLITIDRKNIENNLFFKSVVYTTTKMQTVYQSITSGIANTVNSYFNLIHIRKNNEQLTKENKQLKTELLLFKETQQENVRLRQLIQFTKKADFDLLPAQVIGRSPVSIYHLITINRGTRQGIKKNMMVINETGFVGYIFRVQNDSSQVILLTDPSAAIHVVTQDSRVHGILEGTGKNECHLKYLKRRDIVKKGDVVVTAYSHPLSLTGFPVGTIKQVKKPLYGLTQTVTIKPFINPSQLEEVFVVLKNISQRDQK